MSSKTSEKLNPGVMSGGRHAGKWGTAPLCIQEGEHSRSVNIPFGAFLKGRSKFKGGGRGSGAFKRVGGRLLVAKRRGTVRAEEYMGGGGKVLRF